VLRRCHLHNLYKYIKHFNRESRIPHDIVKANDDVNDLVWRLTILLVEQQKKKLYAPRHWLKVMENISYAYESKSIFNN